MHSAARAWIDTLGLQPHPEGGWYRETYRSELTVPTPRGQRPAATAIYYLLCQGESSHLHRLAADEIWHFYAGGPLTLFLLQAPGTEALRIGPGRPQAVVPAKTWFGAQPDAGSEYALVGCTMAPGFDFADFELGDPHELLLTYPAQQALIARLSLHK